MGPEGHLSIKPLVAFTAFARFLPQLLVHCFCKWIYVSVGLFWELRVELATAMRMSLQLNPRPGSLSMLVCAAIRHLASLRPGNISMIKGGITLTSPEVQSGGFICLHV